MCTPSITWYLGPIQGSPKEHLSWFSHFCGACPFTQPPKSHALHCFSVGWVHFLWDMVFYFSLKIEKNELTLTGWVLELPLGILGISLALVTGVPGTAVAKDIPAGYTIYIQLWETVSDDYGKGYWVHSAKVLVGQGWIQRGDSGGDCPPLPSHRMHGDPP